MAAAVSGFFCYRPFAHRRQRSVGVYVRLASPAPGHTLSRSQPCQDRSRENVKRPLTMVVEFVFLRHWLPMNEADIAGALVMNPSLDEFFVEYVSG